MTAERLIALDDLPDLPLPEQTGEQAAAFRCTDVGNAARLIHRHGPDLHYCEAFAKWLIYDDGRWRLDDTSEVVRRVKETLRQLLAELPEVEDDKERTRLQKHVLDSERAARIRGALELARSEPNISIVPDQLDQDPWLLNVANGTINLRTGELLPHSRAHLISKLAPVDYIPGAPAPRWATFLEQVLPDPDVREFLRRLAGYWLTGVTSEQILVIGYGTGANGKSTFVETIRALLGAYGQQAPAETFLERRDTIPNDVARLRGSRFVAATEISEGRRLNEALVKRLTGGDTIVARFMRGEWFEFAPTFKPFLATNYRPDVRGTDEAIWRRIRLIPFTVTIPPEQRDHDLPAKLRTELPGILSWAVEGCLAWQQDGLGLPDIVAAATSEYREDMDIVGAFLTDCCAINPELKATVSAIYERYVEWANANVNVSCFTKVAGFRARLSWWSGGR